MRPLLREIEKYSPFISKDMQEEGLTDPIMLSRTFAGNRYRSAQKAGSVISHAAIDMQIRISYFLANIHGQKDSPSDFGMYDTSSIDLCIDLPLSSLAFI